MVEAFIDVGRENEQGEKKKDNELKSFEGPTTVVDLSPWILNAHLADCCAWLSVRRLRDLLPHMQDHDQAQAQAQFELQLQPQLEIRTQDPLEQTQPGKPHKICRAPR